MISVFLPCRKGSQRIPDKNIRSFAGNSGGLVSIKISQLLKCDEVDNIIISSNDSRVLQIARDFRETRIILDERPEHLGSSSTTTDELINYVPNVIAEGDVLWTHVTSPFITPEDYGRFISTYRTQLDYGYDSLLTALKIQGFIWDKKGPLSYSRDKIKWPMTQNIEPFYEIDSGAFIANIASYRELGDRIGVNPFICTQDKLKSVDIDWPDDFAYAERLWSRLYHE